MQTIATLAADPVASLVDTAFIGHLGQLGLVPDGTRLHSKQKRLHAAMDTLLQVQCSWLVSGLHCRCTAQSPSCSMFPYFLWLPAVLLPHMGNMKASKTHTYLKFSYISLLLTSMCKPGHCTAHSCVPCAGLKAVQNWCRFTQGSIRSCISSVAPCCHCWRV